MDKELRQRIVETLNSDMPRADLLRAMYVLAKEREFQNLATIWAPALLVRDPGFFEGFLLRNLPRWGQPGLIQAMLPYVEAAGRDSLFSQLYARAVNDTQWNSDILALAQSDRSDDEVFKAVQLRNPRRAWWSLHEATALALYKRNPDLFSPFIRQHVRRGWSRQSETFQKLREAARKNGDDDLYWTAFRAGCDDKSWNEELRRLLRSKPLADQIVAELKKRQPEHIYNFNVEILIDFLEQYGEVTLPFIDENLRWLWGKNQERLLKGLHRLDNPAVYWALFFKVADSKRWNEELRQLLKQQMTDFDLLIEVQRRTPGEAASVFWSRWQLAGDVALTLYRRQPRLMRPLLEAFLWNVDPALFDEAERQGDEDFLDFLTFRMMSTINQLAYRAFPSERMQRWRKPDPQAKTELDGLSALLLKRFERLYRDGGYIRHAANIFAFFQAFQVWSIEQSLTQNPPFKYLAEVHHADWTASPAAIRELLESPNIYVQLVGLHILAGGGDQAADRVIENLPMLQALLLGRTKRNTKKKVLDALIKAGQISPMHAAQILPVLENVIDFRGKRAISERVMTAYIRLKRSIDMQPAAL